MLRQAYSKKGVNKMIVENENIPSGTLLTPDEVAVYFSVSRKTVYRWCDMGLIDCVKVGRVVRIHGKSIVRFSRTSRCRAKHLLETNKDI